MSRCQIALRPKLFNTESLRALERGTPTASNASRARIKLDSGSLTLGHGGSPVRVDRSSIVPCCPRRPPPQTATGMDEENQGRRCAQLAASSEQQAASSKKHRRQQRLRSKSVIIASNASVSPIMESTVFSNDAQAPSMPVDENHLYPKDMINIASCKPLTRKFTGRRL